MANGARERRKSKTFQSIVISAPWLSVGDKVAVYEGGTLDASQASGLALEGTLTQAAFVEATTLSSMVTEVSDGNVATAVEPSGGPPGGGGPPR